MLKLWEVVSVVQDLEYKKQLEILDMLNVNSTVLVNSEFRSDFLLSDQELTVKLKKVAKLDKEGTKEITRLIALFTIGLSTIPIRQEFNEYYATLPFETQLAAYKILPSRFITVKTKKLLARGAVDAGLENVRKLRSTRLIDGQYIFSQAVKKDKLDIVDEMLQVNVDSAKVPDYIDTALDHAREDVLERILNKYQGDRGYLLDNISFLETDDGDEKIRTRVRMLLTINPEAELKDYSDLIGKDPRLLAIFVLETFDRFSWLDRLDVSLINDIFNNQV